MTELSLRFKPDKILLINLTQISYIQNNFPEKFKKKSLKTKSNQKRKKRKRKENRKINKERRKRESHCRKTAAQTREAHQDLVEVSAISKCNRCIIIQNSSYYLFSRFNLKNFAVGGRWIWGFLLVGEFFFLRWIAALVSWLLKELGRKQMPEEDLVELKFRLYDGSDIGPFRYSPTSTVAMLKERIVAEWPKG